MSEALPAIALSPPDDILGPISVAPPGWAYRNVITGSLARIAGSAEASYQSGMDRLSRGLLDEAAELFSRVRSEHAGDPRSQDAAFWLAEIRKRQGRMEEAMGLLRLVRGAFRAEASFRLAWLLTVRGRESEATGLMKGLAQEPAGEYRIRALLWLGTSSLHRGAAEEAASLLKTAAGATGATAEAEREAKASAVLALGLALRVTGDLAAAERTLEQSLLERPDAPTARPCAVALAWVLLEAGKPGEAAQRFGWLLESAPSSETSVQDRYGRIRALAESGDLAGAERELAGLEATDGEGVWGGRGCAALARADFERGRYEEARKLWSAAARALEREESQVARFLAALCLQRLGRGSEAIEELRAVDGAAWLQAAALHLAGDAALARGNAADARELFERSRQTEPAYSRSDCVWAGLGEARLRLDLLEEASRAFDHVPPQSPCFPDALYGKASVALRRGRWEEASALLEEFVRAYPAHRAHEGALFQLAQAYSERKALQPALRALETLLAETRSAELRSSARFQQGRVLALSGDPSAARKIFESLLSDEPKGPLAPKLHHAVARLAMDQESFAEALTHLEAAAVLDPDPETRERLLADRAASLFGLKRYPEAMEAYSALGAGADALYGQALCLNALGRVEDLARAAESFAAAYPGDKRSAQLFLALGQRRDEQRNWAAAAAAYLEAAARAPGAESAARARRRAALSLVEAGDLPRAASILSELSADEGDAGLEALTDLAAIAEGRGDAAQAAKAWDRVAVRARGEGKAQALRSAARHARFRLDWAGSQDRLEAALTSCPPGRVELRQSLLVDLGSVLLLSGKPSEAIAPLAQAADAGLGPMGLQALLTLGRAQEAAGRPEEALETYLRIGYLYGADGPRAAEALLRAGAMLEAFGRAARAETVYAALARGSSGSHAEEARRRLTALQERSGAAARPSAP